MKVLASVKRICRNCKIIRRHGIVRVICTDPRHKQRQGRSLGLYELSHQSVEDLTLSFA